jgi:cation:H+ antiporter
MTIAMLLLGLALLTAGAEILVRGASKLALFAGISPLVVGLTVVAFGTSAPELVVSVQSSLAGNGEVALGNVVGSNIFNVLFILGISALIIPLRVAQQLIWFDVPLMIGLSFLVLLFGLDGRIGFFEGLSLTFGLVVYTTWAIVQSRKESSDVREEYQTAVGKAKDQKRWQELSISVMCVAVGLGLLILGSRWFVSSAVSIARDFNVPELIIGLTIVAAGTSLPEVATSIMAALRGERDIAVGNVVGSNLFNMLGVLGVSSLVGKHGLAVPSEALWLDIPVMIAVAGACLPVFLTGHLIARWEGAMFVGYYVAYTTYLILVASKSEGSQLFGITMLVFVIPLTAITLAIGVWRTLKNRKASEGD